MRPLNRPQPIMPVIGMKTYAIRSPVPTHFRDASCKEVECQRMARGWRTVLDTSDPAKARVATWIRMKSGRRFTIEQVGTVATFTFPAGQSCFEPHKVPLGRPELFVVRDGDWRGNPTGRRFTHTRAADWVEDFALHQDNIARTKERG